VRVSLFSKGEGRHGSGVAEYPMRRSTKYPNLATQSHLAQMDALERAMHAALPDALHDGGVAGGDQVAALTLRNSSLLFPRDQRSLPRVSRWSRCNINLALNTHNFRFTR
jgi:hypothetical protein